MIERPESPKGLVDLSGDDLAWFEGEDAGEDSGLGCNRDYRDLRGATLGDAHRVLQEERRLMDQLAADEWELAKSEGGPEVEGLELGVASVVFALSVIGCIPFNSCNGGAFGGDHQAEGPVVGFHARPDHLKTICDVSGSGDVTLCAERGALWLSSSSPEAMMSWAASLMQHLSGEVPPSGPGSASGQRADCPDDVI
jgi:hypothetical protein